MFLGKKYVLAALILAVAVSAAHAQTFGKSKKKIVLHRKLPAIAPLTGKTFTVRVTVRDPKHKDLAGKLTDMVEAEIIRNDRRLSAEKAGGENVISCSINNVSTPPPTPVNRNVVNEQKVGKDMRKASEQHTFMKVSGMLSLSYQARSKAGSLLDSDNISVKFSETYDDETGQAAAKGWFDVVKRPIKKIVPGKSDEEAPQNQEELEQALLNRAAAQVAMHVVNTDVSTTVVLAYGKGLDNACKLAEASQYSRMLESLETMEPFPRGEDDAYRLYDVGVAYEAMAYKAEDPKSAGKFLEEAAINYGKALDAHPSEQYMADAQQRIDVAAAHFKRILNQPAPVSAAPAPAGGTTTTASTASKTMTNDQVVQLVKAGLSEDNVLAAIKSAPSVQFDVTANGQLALVQSGVSNRVISAMRDRATVRPAAGKKTTAAPKQKSLSDVLAK